MAGNEFFKNLKVGDTVAVVERVEVTYGWGEVNYDLSKSFETHLTVERVLKTQFVAGGKKFVISKYGSSIASGYGDNKMSAQVPRLAKSQDRELLEYQIFIDELHAENARTPEVSLMRAKSVEAAKAIIELSKQAEELRKQMRSLIMED